MNRRAWALLVAALILGVGIGGFLGLRKAPPSPSASTILANSPVDAGAFLSGRAPTFQLTDQFGKTVTLRQFRGKVVVLAFVDSQCTTVCPLTTASMVDAEELLGQKASRHIVLLGINANPTATTIADVRQYSEAHGLMNRWLFLTAPPAELDKVWKAYGIFVAVSHGQIDHTPALYVIGANGRERWVAQTAMEYRAVNTEALVLAEVVRKALPASTRPTLPRLTVPPPPAPKTATLSNLRSGGRIPLGGHGPTLVVFVASWSPGLAAEWRSLASQSHRHPGVRLVLVDIGTVEPQPGAFSHWLARHPGLPPVAIGFDATGQVADALGAQNVPDAVLVTGKGKVLWRSETWPTSANWATMESRLTEAGR